MFTQSSAPSTTSSTPSAPSSRSPSPEHFQDARSTPSPSPSPFYTPSGSPPPHPEQPHLTSPQLPSSILESPPLDSRPFVPHAVGLGIAAPRPVFGPFSPFHKEHMAQLQTGASPVQMRSDPFDSPSLIAASSNSSGFLGPFHSSNAGSPLHSPPISSDRKSPFVPSDSNHIDPDLSVHPPHTSLPASSLSNLLSEDVEVSKPASNPPPLASPQSETSPSLQRPVSPQLGSVTDTVLTQAAVEEPSHTSGTNIPSSGRRPSIDLGGILNMTQPEPLAGAANSLTPSNPLAVNPLDEATTSTSFPTATDDPSQLALNEIDADGLSTLEKIYLFAKSRLGFHRVYIAKSLAGFLQAGIDADAASHSQEDGAPNPDHISTEEAVEYILPLLNGLAMDEDEAVKEALAGELVSIIWWYITRCKLVEDDTVLSVDEGAENVPLQQGTDILHHPYHVDQSSPHPGLPHHLSESQNRPTSPSPFAHSPLVDFIRSNSRPSTPRPPTPRPLSPPPETVPLRPPTPPPPTRISVQSFTPMLGTLLLSTNAHVGGPARFAVVELLKRVRRADEVEGQIVVEGQGDDASPMRQDPSPSRSPQPSRPGTGSSNSQKSSSWQADNDEEDEHHPVGLLGELERRLFEKEMIQQVVIGMGRLDLELSEEYHGTDAMHSEGDDMSTSDMSTPIPPHTEATYTTEPTDSYFPTVSHAAESQATTQSAPPDNQLTSFSATSISPPLHTVSPPPFAPAVLQDTHTTSGVMSPPLEFPSRPPGLASSATQSPLSSSPLTSLHSNSTPSLTSTSSSSSAEACSHSSSSSTSPLSPPSLSPGSRVGIAEHNAYVLPRSPGDLPPISDEERRQWEQQYALPTNFSLHPGMGLSDSSSTVHPSMSAVGWGADLQSPAMGGETPSNDLEHDLSAEAAVGRLSSMSLMAAVTASGTIAEDTKTAFVAEVERVGRDAVYWVRREASFTVGALAKVVSVEVVRTQLMPLFKLLCGDSFWQVRHSALFALPNILLRLDLAEKHQLALDVILPLSKDESSTVRSGVLEALAEVIYTFADDEGGPPAELLRLFLGIREGETDPQPITHPQPQKDVSTMTWAEMVAAITGSAPLPDPKDLDVYNDPARPLICAFNFPAVALTLGPERWHELRSLYHELSLYPSRKVRTTLAASLGELAKIIGPQQAKEDLMGVWWGSVRDQESEVRQKAIDCLAVFVEHIAGEARRDVFAGLVSELWDGKFRNWREREGVMKHMPAFISTAIIQEDVLLKLFTKGLEDSVAAVREAAISSIPVFISEWAPWPQWIDRVFQIFRPYATHSSYRKRILYVACQQEVVVSGNHQHLVENDEFWDAMQVLAGDSIVDVRIPVARLLGHLSDNMQDPSDRFKANILSLAQKMSGDTSQDVQRFTKPIRSGLHPIFHPRNDSGSVIRAASNFSRPPPPSD